MQGGDVGVRVRLRQLEGHLGRVVAEGGAVYAEQDPAGHLGTSRSGSKGSVTGFTSRFSGATAIGPVLIGPADHAA